MWCSSCIYCSQGRAEAILLGEGIRSSTDFNLPAISILLTNLPTISSWFTDKSLFSDINSVFADEVKGKWERGCHLPPPYSLGTPLNPEGCSNEGTIKTVPIYLSNKNMSRIYPVINVPDLLLLLIWLHVWLSGWENIALFNFGSVSKPGCYFALNLSGNIDVIICWCFKNTRRLCYGLRQEL